jgi:hypothetical protein
MAGSGRLRARLRRAKEIPPGIGLPIGIRLDSIDQPSAAVRGGIAVCK